MSRHSSRKVQKPAFSPPLQSKNDRDRAMTVSRLRTSFASSLGLRAPANSILRRRLAAASPALISISNSANRWGPRASRFLAFRVVFAATRFPHLTRPAVYRPKAIKRRREGFVAEAGKAAGMTVAAIRTAPNAVAPPSRKEAEAPAQLPTRPAIANEIEPEIPTPRVP